MKKTLLIILIISISIFGLLFSVEKNTFNYDYYYSSYNTNDVLRIAGKNIEELMDITDDLLNYLKGKVDKEVLEEYYNEKEILHLEDVRLLFDYGFIIKYIFLGLSIISLIILIYQRELKAIGKYLSYGLFINHIILILLIILSYFDFNKIFTYFHLILFTNDLWLLNPNTDLLIQMLPLDFFIGIAIRIALSFFIYLAIIQGIGIILMKKGRDK